MDIVRKYEGSKLNRNALEIVTALNLELAVAGDMLNAGEKIDIDLVIQMENLLFYIENRVHQARATSPVSMKSLRLEP